METPKISVGLLLAEFVNFRIFIQNEINEFSAKLVNGKICIGKDLYEEISYSPDYFEIVDVVIGIGFHWERKETQRFKGDLLLRIENDKIRVINKVDVETYLESVISSEMSSTASLNLLKAHALISRSWLLHPILNKERNETRAFHEIQHEDELIRWYERDAHQGFDVCADDHCQRYQGITRMVGENASKAVRETSGLVLMYEDKVCDARFSKCCGGVTEEFESCWSDQHFDYLLSFTDAEKDDIKIESEAGFIEFQKSKPKVWCNTHNPKILNQVLNNYDQETNDFFRWEVRYTQTEISDLIKRKSGKDFGKILDLKVVERTKSGRIIRLKIEGEKLSLIVGKELEIRKYLSESHLYSSAFWVERDQDTFILKGAGWGHGVGLCQIGAAVMGEEGKSYEEILTHYYPNSEIVKLY